MCGECNLRRFKDAEIVCYKLLREKLFDLLQLENTCFFSDKIKALLPDDRYADHNKDVCVLKILIFLTFLS